ncbi:hypothetical protein HCC61_10855 [Streptomyces sp. HNM0575]|uniref:hypothetical protein n=1 Tax=Streptomyces sp. HNM0575 TaxID=2716338 RepID=UPI00145F58B2|nr:hypothetical protein [Streptomyces sp. HNM0575]NLU73173.1 hypothetical protein [Streptomyces sp. HNM0575]
MTTSVPEATVSRFMTVFGVLALFWTLLHAGLIAVALTAGPTTGSTTEALRAMTYSSPLLLVLSFCGAALAFSGRRPARRPGLAGAAFLVLALVCAVVVATCAALLILDAGQWALVLVAINLPLVLVLAVCRRVFRSAQRSGPGAGSGRTGTGTAR